MRAYLSQHCFFLPLPHVPIGIQNAAGTSEKQQQKNSLHKGNTGSQTLDYGLLPTRVDSYVHDTIIMYQLWQCTIIDRVI